MARIVEEYKRLVALLMIRSDLVSYLIYEITEALEVYVLSLNDVSLFRTQSHNSFSYILSIFFYFRKVHEILETFVFSSLGIIRICDDNPYELGRLKDRNLKAV